MQPFFTTLHPRQVDLCIGVLREFMQWRPGPAGRCRDHTLLGLGYTHQSGKEVHTVPATRGAASASNKRRRVKDDCTPPPQVDAIAIADRVTPANVSPPSLDSREASNSSTSTSSSFLLSSMHTGAGVAHAGRYESGRYEWQCEWPAVSTQEAQDEEARARSEYTEKQLAPEKQVAAEKDVAAKKHVAACHPPPIDIAAYLTPAYQRTPIIHPTAHSSHATHTHPSHIQLSHPHTSHADPLTHTVHASHMHLSHAHPSHTQLSHPHTTHAESHAHLHPSHIQLSQSHTETFPLLHPAHVQLSHAHSHSGRELDIAAYLSSSLSPKPHYSDKRKQAITTRTHTDFISASSMGGFPEGGCHALRGGGAVGGDALRPHQAASYYLQLGAEM
jgi:hypothetical protein